VSPELEKILGRIEWKFRRRRAEVLNQKRKVNGSRLRELEEKKNRKKEG